MPASPEELHKSQIPIPKPPPSHEASEGQRKATEGATKPPAPPAPPAGLPFLEKENEKKFAGKDPYREKI